jgi:SAM-dependent methyltransferase
MGDNSSTKAATVGNEATSEVRDGYRWVAQKCPVCVESPSRYVGRRGGAAHRAGLGVECAVYRCGRCGLVYPNPMPVPAGGLGQHYALDPEEYFRHHDPTEKVAASRGRLQHAERLAGGKGRVLDIGAGRGELLKAAAEEGWEAVGVEPSAPFAEFAARWTGAKVVCEPVEQCDFEAGEFDAVILGAVLEHLYNPDETIAAVSRVLRPGGVLFVDVPNEQGLYFRVGNLYQRLRRRDWTVNLAPTFEPYHVFGFGPRSLRALLSKHGLAVRDWRVYGGQSWVPDRGGLLGKIEQLAARGVSALSDVGGLGTYIETWAVKR